MANSLKDMVYHSVMTDIFNNVFNPGDILTERALIERYECSKSPVREALLSLCQDDVLRNIPRCGYEVTHMTHSDVTQLLQVRYLLEGGLLKDSITVMQTTGFDSLLAIDREITFCEGDVLSLWDLNVQFHLEMVRSSGNEVALNELRLICNKLKLAYVQMKKDKWNSRTTPYNAANHKEILRCLRENDLQGARKALWADLASLGNMQYDIPDYFG